jgi:hypothetical protein
MKLTLYVDFPDTDRGVGKINLALIIHDDSGSGMRERTLRRRERNRHNNNCSHPDFSD